jgi:cytoskeletal protein CcmA (bactofilin family)
MAFDRKSGRRKHLEELLDDDMVALIEPGVEMEGRMRISSGMVRLNSHFKGEIHSEGALIIAEQGEIDGDLRAKNVSVSGKVKGSVHAAERLEINEHGVVLGDIFTPTLIVHPGCYFDGQCHMPTPEPEKSEAEHTDSKDRP